MLHRLLLLPALACCVHSADPLQTSPDSPASGGRALGQHAQDASAAYEKDGPQLDPKAVNGKLYIKGTVDIRGIDKMVIDDTVRIMRWDRHEAAIFGYRYLSFSGHPGRKLDYRELKPEGMAYKIENEKLIIRDYITWQGEEGGAGISVVIAVPKETVTIQKPFRGKGEGGRVDLNDELNNNWSHLASDGYKKIIFEPDAKQTFKDHVPNR